MKTIEAATFVKNNTRVFLDFEHIWAKELAAKLVLTALVSGASDISVSEVHGYTVLSSSQNWFTEDFDKFTSYFELVVPFKELGENSSRYEVVLFTLAENIIIANRGSYINIKGKESFEFIQGVLDKFEGEYALLYK